MSTDRVVRLDATVTGRVQGVSFRYYTLQEAQRLGLVGWVANQRDGSVKVVAEGPESVLQAFVGFLRTGSPLAVVDKVIESRGLATGEFSSFRIRSI
ncbi:MAG: acylphosphatase [Chloroflexota bacterium]